MGAKERVATIVAEQFGRIDYLIYSVAAPRRTETSGQTHRSVIKPVGSKVRMKTLAFESEQPVVRESELPPATDEEIHATVKVMGGEDWSDWVETLAQKSLLAPNFKTVALSYVGSGLTSGIYRDGTIGKAKDHLEGTADKLTTSTLNLFPAQRIFPLMGQPSRRHRRQFQV